MNQGLILATQCRPKQISWSISIWAFVTLQLVLESMVQRTLIMDAYVSWRLCWQGLEFKVGGHVVLLYRVEGYDLIRSNTERDFP